MAFPTTERFITITSGEKPQLEVAQFLSPDTIENRRRALVLCDTCDYHSDVYTGCKPLGVAAACGGFGKSTGIAGLSLVHGVGVWVQKEGTTTPCELDLTELSGQLPARKKRGHRDPK